MNILRQTSCLAVLLGLGLVMAHDARAASTDVLFQGLVDRRTVESRPNSGWLFQRPIFSRNAPPYVIYEGDKILRLMPGDSFLVRLDIDMPQGPRDMLKFVVTSEEMTQKTFRSLRGEIRSTTPDGGKRGSFRFTSKLGGSEMTGCIQIEDRDYCFVGKYGVGWMS